MTSKSVRNNAGQRDPPVTHPGPSSREIFDSLSCGSPIHICVLQGQH